MGTVLAALSAQAEPKVKLGIDFLRENKFQGLEGKRVGLITNQTGIASTGESTVEILSKATGVNLVALYAPEHGIYGDELAGEKVKSTKDPRTGLPVFSLYGETRKPTPEMLENIDVLIFDIQDIGCRSYTYISTMGLAMEAAGENGKEFFVLDRPNPLGGNRVEGPPLDPEYRSFVGQWDIPYIYGLTAGELARMINAQKWIKRRPKLVIVPMKGWRRDMTWADTGLVWVPSSPNIPHSSSCLYYAITGLVGEGIYVNHGVGYTLPFETLARPDFDPFKMAEQLNAKQLPGVLFRPTFYTTFFGSFKDKISKGVQIFVTDPAEANLVNTSMVLIEHLAKQEGPRNLFSVNARKPASLFMKVCGGDAILKHFEAGKSAEALIATWEPSLAAFRQLRKQYLLYTDGSKEPPATSP